MISDSTVLVLGAGASIEYGFPDGVKLRQQIVREIRQGVDDLERGNPDASSVFALLYQLEESPSEKETPGKLLRFANALENSGLSSVDLFLERRPEFEEIGKAAIAVSLMRYEDPVKLHDRTETEPRWYEYLWGRLTADADGRAFGSNKLSIVTFNYDRSLEQFLYTAMEETYPSDADRLWKNTVPICHVHGQLGEYSPGASNHRDYQQEFGLGELRRARDAIRIVSDADAPSTLGMVWNRLEHAEIVCFLGFDYHLSNMSKLNEGDALLSRPKTIYGTTMGVGEARRERIREFFVRAGKGHNVKFDDGRRDVKRYLEHMGCLA